MTSDDQIVRAYLQRAHNMGGSHYMAMLMMVDRMVLLEDRLTRAGVAIEEDKTIAMAEKGVAA